MPTQDQIETAIAEIVPGGKFPASKLNPLLSDMLSFSSELDVYDGLTADGTTALNTKLILSYGLNEITTITATNYACLLPKPVTGRRLTVVNRSFMSLKVYPSNPGGVIHNNAIDAPVSVPPDGKPYIFTCIENPLPGAWVWTAPAINQFDSGEITVTTTNDTFGSYIMSNSVSSAETTSYGGGNGPSFNGLNAAVTFGPINNGPYPNTDYFVSFKPATAWNAILKIKVYTNIIYDPAVLPNRRPSAGITQGCHTNQYLAGTTTFVSANGDANAGNFGPSTLTTLSNLVPDGGYIITPGLSANVGDPGTSWGEIVDPAWAGFNNSTVGDKFMSTDGTLDTWFTRDISFFLRHRAIGNVKFRFFIEYM